MLVRRRAASILRGVGVGAAVVGVVPAVAAMLTAGEPGAGVLLTGGAVLVALSVAALLVSDRLRKRNPEATGD